MVRGVGHYGNCVGVPNVGGEVCSSPAYEQNCLVNAMCVGLLPADALHARRRRRRRQPGRPVRRATGRDGIGGASVLASQDLDEGDADKRPSVQIGDPFTGKKLIECTLELLERGAAGLAAGPGRGRPGVVDVRDGGERRRRPRDRPRSRVPLREEGMQPFEIMISESQERMAAIVEPARLGAVVEACAPLGPRLPR